MYIPPPLLPNSRPLFHSPLISPIPSRDIIHRVFLFFFFFFPFRRRFRAFDQQKFLTVDSGTLLKRVADDGVGQEIKPGDQVRDCICRCGNGCARDFRSSLTCSHPRGRLIVC